jgi:hypothetical protein
MAFRPTPETIERAKLAIEAAGVFTENAPSIASACAEAVPNEIVVAVTGPSRDFRGVHVKPLGELYRTVMGQEPGSWTLVFSPGDALPEIQLRCMKMARYAEARYRLARRIASR